MTEGTRWQPLPLPASSSVPNILAHFDVGVASYSIRLTDLANVWTESLDRRAICRRAWDENTPVDPSDTPENMTIFLASLKAALDPSDPAYDSTSLRLASGTPQKSQASDDGSLTLQVTCQITGLGPLKWLMHLQKSPASAIAACVTFPLVQTQLARDRDVEALCEILRHKDIVISKLLDKLEALGTGLDHVFNSLSGKQKVDRAFAESKVRGLKPFDAREWKNSHGSSKGNFEGSPPSTEHILDTRGLLLQESQESEHMANLDTWWHDFSIGGSTPPNTATDSNTSSKKTTRTASPPPKRPTPINDNDSDDDFQVQQTPPHLKAHSSRPTTSKLPVDEALGKKAKVSSPVRAPEETPSLESPPPQPMSRIGAIGGKKRGPQEKVPSPIKSRITPPAAEDSETASEAEVAGQGPGSDSDATASGSDSSHPSSPAPVRAPPRNVGRIGGVKPPPPRPEPDATESEVPPPLNGPANVTSPPKRIGAIGRIQRGVTSHPPEIEQVDTVIRGRKPIRDGDGGAGVESGPSEQAKSPKETSQERADRRRDELKRELERKAAAGPAKKKRRF